MADPTAGPGAAPGTPDAGWSLALPHHLPRPTSAPALCAAGVVLVFWSIVASAILAAFGGALFLVSFVIWIRELTHERRTEHPPRP